MRNDIVQIARTWLGTPFRFAARVKGVGVDCGGLIVCVMAEVGIQIPDPPEVRHRKILSQGQMTAYYDSVGERITSPLPGDFALFWGRYRRKTVGYHSGIVSGPNSMIHAIAYGQRCVVETALDSFDPFVISYYRHPKVV